MFKTLRLPLLALLLTTCLWSCQQKLYRYNYRGEDQSLTYESRALEKGEKKYLRAISEVNSLRAYRDYYQRYPDGVFAAQARRIIKETETYLRRAGKTSAALLDQTLPALFAQDFPPLDSDGDGVPDYLDVEISTPQGYPVAADGRSLDSDGDGVPDGRDREPDSPPGAEVDADGRTIPPQSSSSETEAQLRKAYSLRDYDYLRRFLQEHPDSPFAPTVEDWLSELDTKPGSDSEEILAEQAWERLKDSPSRTDLQNFIDRYSGTAAATKAQQRLRDLGEAAQNTTGGKSKGENSTVDPTQTNVLPADSSATADRDTLGADPQVRRDSCLQNSIDEGVLAFNLLPSEMVLDSIYAFYVKINDLSEIDAVAESFSRITGQEIDAEVINPYDRDTTDGGVVFEALKIGSEMKVQLQTFNEAAFNIKAQHSQAVQKIDCDLTASWNWDIQPREKGPQRLRLIIEVLVDGQPRLSDINIPPKDILVTVRQPERTWWPWVLGGMALLGLLLLIFFRRRRSAAEPEAAGFGTAMGLATLAPQQSKSVFIAYAPQDAQWTERIYQQLKTLDKSGFVNIWYDKMVVGGEDYRATVMAHLQAAQLVLLNVSADFLASDFCDEVVRAAAARVAAGEDCRILPILIRPCLWKASPVAKYPVFPKNEEALTSSEWDSPDEALYQVFLEMEKELLLPGGSMQMP
ncbi:MAG: TIR domain-containing protein [Bacteroidota bacterium]